MNNFGTLTRVVMVIFEDISVNILVFVLVSVFVWASLDLVWSLFKLS